jgi:hypothetical protein
MKYYTYISDSKLEMLYRQIPPKITARIAAEFKLDLRVIAVSLRHDPSEENRYGKLRIVESYVDRNFQVGKVADPTPWFRGSMTLRSSIYRNRLLLSTGLHLGVRVILIGSSRHLLGGQYPVGDQAVSFSGIAAAMDVLEQIVPVLSDLVSESDAKGDDSDIRVKNSARLLAEIHTIAFDSTGIDESCEFLARRLLVGDDGLMPTRVLLGTPLYVALND